MPKSLTGLDQDGRSDYETRALSSRNPDLGLKETLAKLKGYFIKRNYSRWDSEDLSQEVFCKLLGMGRCLQQEQQAYIYKVAYTLLIDKYRYDQRRHRSDHISAADADFLEDDNNTPHQKYVEHRALSNLTLKLSQLTELQRETYMEVKFSGKKIREVARDRKVSESAVEKNLAKARKHMLKDADFEAA